MIKLLVALIAAALATACEGTTTPSSPAASLRVTVTPNPLPSVAPGNPIFFDVAWNEVAGVGVTVHSDLVRLIDASGQALEGQLTGCFTGPPCALQPFRIAAHGQSGLRRPIMVVGTPAVRLEYQVQGTDDNGHTVTASLQVPVL